MKKTFHPLTWWCGAIAIAIAVSVAHHTAFNLAVVGGMCFIVYRLNRNAIDQSPWSRGLWFALKIAAIIIVIRTFIGIAIGVPIPGNTLFELPIVDLPEWMAGIRVGGAITQESSTSASDACLHLRIWSRTRYRHLCSSTIGNKCDKN